MTQPAFAGIDVAFAKQKRLPVCVAMWKGGRLEPLPLRRDQTIKPPLGRGNAKALTPDAVTEFCQATLRYLRNVERAYSIEIATVAIDAPSDPRADGEPRRAAEKALDRRRISCYTTPSTSEFDEIRKRAMTHLEAGGAEPNIPHANQLWMLVGFGLFEMLRPHYECLEVFPQATAFELGAASVHKSKGEGTLAQLTAASRYTGWPEPPEVSDLHPISYGSVHDKLDAYLSAWVAALDQSQRLPLGAPPNAVIWIPRLDQIEKRPVAFTLLVDDVRPGRDSSRLTRPTEPKVDKSAPRPSKAGESRTTQVGYRNRNWQVVVRPTGEPGTDHFQYIYVLRCRFCEAEYGANGSDIHLRKCPSCQGGRPGLPI